MRSPRFWIWLACGLAVLPQLTGCAADSEGRDQRSKSTVPAQLPRLQVEQLVKKDDLPDLPDGAGTMDSDAPEQFTTTRSGLYYRILRKSNGRKPRTTDTVLAHYRGWLDNGKQFDSSYERGEPTEFPLNGVVPGWTEGLQLIGVGGMIELEVPPGLGYGAQGRPGIPPNATLHFIIELKEIK
jgi:FKBP-type peptidyl-prolyl cis-trans isomerase FkpA